MFSWTISAAKKAWRLSVSDWQENSCCFHPETPRTWRFYQICFRSPFFPGGTGFQTNKAHSWSTPSFSSTPLWFILVWQTSSWTISHSSGSSAQWIGRYLWRGAGPAWICSLWCRKIWSIFWPGRWTSEIGSLNFCSYRFLSWVVLSQTTPWGSCHRCRCDSAQCWNSGNERKRKLLGYCKFIPE